MEAVTTVDYSLLLLRLCSVGIAFKVCRTKGFDSQFAFNYSRSLRGVVPPFCNLYVEENVGHLVLLPRLLPAPIFPGRLLPQRYIAVGRLFMLPHICSKDRAFFTFPTLSLFFFFGAKTILRT